MVEQLDSTVFAGGRVHQLPVEHHGKENLCGQWLHYIIYLNIVHVCLLFNIADDLVCRI